MLRYTFFTLVLLPLAAHAATPGQQYYILPAKPPVVSLPPEAKPPVRLLVFREDDRAATKSFHPLLTPTVPVTITPAAPHK